MAINKDPIYTGVGDIQWIGPMTAANTTKDLTSGTTYLGFTADATYGGFVRYARFQALGTNSAATALRIWLNNGSTTGTAANNTMIYQQQLPATTNSEVVSLVPIDIPLNIAIPPGYRIYFTLGTAPNSAGWQGTVVGGNYTAQ